MRLDRKFFLILPSIVLVLVSAGLFYTATRLREIVAGSDDLTTRRAYVSSVERGERVLTAPHAVELIDVSLQAEAKRTAAIVAARDLLVLLGWIALACCSLLLWTIRRVPRERPPGSPELAALARNR